jgi:hypothetical protein
LQAFYVAVHQFRGHPLGNGLKQHQKVPVKHYFDRLARIHFAEWPGYRHNGSSHITTPLTLQAFYADNFVLPLPPGHRFPMAKYRLLRDRLVSERPRPPRE